MSEGNSDSIISLCSQSATFETILVATIIYKLGKESLEIKILRKQRDWRLKIINKAIFTRMVLEAKEEVISSSQASGKAFRPQKAILKGICIRKERCAHHPSPQPSHSSQGSPNILRRVLQNIRAQPQHHHKVPRPLSPARQYNVTGKLNRPLMWESCDTEVVNSWCGLMKRQRRCVTGFS